MANTIWIDGDTSDSQTLTDDDHLYPGHINQLREANPSTVTVDTTGNGQFDDIQEAINAITSTGGLVIIKEGTYEIDSLITIPSGVSIKGISRESVIIKGADDSAISAILLKTGSGSISDLTINGNIDNIGSSPYGISITSANDVLINNVKIYNTHIGIQPSNCSRVNILNSYLYNISFRGIQVNSSTYVMVYFNRLVNIEDSHGIAFETDSSFGIAHGNIVIGAGQFGISAAFSSNNCIFSSNITRDTTLEGLQITSCQGGKITNNHVYGALTDFGISIWTNPSYRSCEHIEISNNYVFQSYKSGISVKACTYASVIGNHLYNCVTGGESSNERDAINVQDSSFYCTISDNIIIDVKSPITHVYAINESDSDYNLFANNIAKGYTTGGVNKTGSNSVLTAGISQSS